jgi:hypothetical protein
MANDIAGTVGFNCMDKNNSSKAIVHEDITVRADWRSRPSVVLELFAQEARRLSRITGRIGAKEGCHRAIFNGDISNYRVIKRGVFTCDHGNGNVTNVYHDVYTLRLKDEPPAETESRLKIDAVKRHKGLVVLDCKGSVEFTGKFVDPSTQTTQQPVVPQKKVEPKKESLWSRIVEALKDAFRTSVETRVRIAKEDKGWSYGM